MSLACGVQITVQEPREFEQFDYRSKMEREDVGREEEVVEGPPWRSWSLGKGLTTEALHSACSITTLLNWSSVSWRSTGHPCERAIPAQQQPITAILVSIQA